MTNKALKDWSTVISALGRGDQIILIRRKGRLITKKQGRFRLAHDEFALYPTYGHLEEIFKERYQNLFKESNTSRPPEGVKIEYLAKCEEIIEVDNPEKLGRLSDFFVWTRRHVEKYFENTKDGKLYILILRVYKLLEPRIIEELRPMVWVTLPCSLSPQNGIPVLSNEEFNQKKAEIKRILDIQIPPTPEPQLEIACPQKVNVGEEIAIKITANENPTEGVNVLINDNSIGMTGTNGEITNVFNETGSFSITVAKDGYTSASAIIEVRDENEHEILIRVLNKLAVILGYEIGGRRLGHFILDVTWKKRLRSDPTHAFEVHIKGDLYKDIASLKEACDRWGATPFLISSEEELERARGVISGAFHEIEDKIVYIKKEDLRDFYFFKNKFKELESWICL